MILVELNGGLGNQLFQYAAAKSLSLHQQAPLKLDASFFQEKGKDHELHYFHITEETATAEEIGRLSDRTPLQRISDKLKPPFKRSIYREPHYHFDEQFYQATDPVYLKGIRQTERYFKAHEEEIRQLLRIRPEYINRVTELGERMAAENSISIHIRRGDYLTPIALKVLGLMPLEYYQAALQELLPKVSQPKLYFFSDDIDWVRSNFDLSIDHEFISGAASKSAIEDFYLMSRCRHNIIANSSFSWWSAWLNEHPDKLVVAPKKWFNEEPPGDDRDLIPPSWLRL